MYAVFDPTVTQLQKREILSSKIANATLKKTNWFIFKDDYYEKKWNLIFSRMVEAKNTRLSIGMSKRQSIPKQIVHIVWSNLQDLNLSNNKINNIQALIFMNLPNLRNLYLCYNVIVVLKSLDKSYWPNMQYFSIYQNYPQVNQMNKIKIISHMQNLSLQNFFTIRVTDDLAVFSKCQAQGILYLSYYVSQCRRQNIIFTNKSAQIDWSFKGKIQKEMRLDQFYSDSKI